MFWIKSNQRRIVSTHVFWLPILACIFAGDATATLLIFQWTPKYILIAGDSLTNYAMQDGQVSSRTTCKIHREGDIFFSVVGISRDFVLNIDLTETARTACARGGSIEDVLSRFDAAGYTAIGRIFDKSAKNPSVGSLTSLRIGVVMVSAKEQAVGLEEYWRQSDGTVAREPLHVWGSTNGRDSQGINRPVGIFEADAQRVYSAPELSGATFLEAVIEAQIRSEKSQKMPRVGRPIWILRIEKGKASWAPGHQVPCADIVAPRPVVANKSKEKSTTKKKQPAVCANH